MKLVHELAYTKVELLTDSTSILRIIPTRLVHELVYTKAEICFVNFQKNEINLVFRFSIENLDFTDQTKVIRV